VLIAATVRMGMKQHTAHANDLTPQLAALSSMRDRIGSVIPLRVPAEARSRRDYRLVPCGRALS
jgi:hypothetical protein